MILYAGPGLDGGLIAAILGILLSIFLGIFALVWFPIKKGINKIRAFFKKTDSTIK